MNNEKGTKMTDYAETRMYGMTAVQILAQYMESLTAKMSGQEMVVMGILSDCQEMLSMGAGARSVEYVRQQMNVAKFILCEMMDNKESV
jgi:predicted membrane-bound spermidine synthase